MSAFRNYLPEIMKHSFVCIKGRTCSMTPNKITSLYFAASDGNSTYGSGIRCGLSPPETKMLLKPESGVVLGILYENRTGCLTCRAEKINKRLLHHKELPALIWFSCLERASRVGSYPTPRNAMQRDAAKSHALHHEGEDCAVHPECNCHNHVTEGVHIPLLLGQGRCLPHP